MIILILAGNTAAKSGVYSLHLAQTSYKNYTLMSEMCKYPPENLLEPTSSNFGKVFDDKALLVT